MSTSASSDSWDTARVEFPTLPKPGHLSLQEALESQSRLSGLLIADANGLLINGKRRRPQHAALASPVTHASLLAAKGDLTGNDAETGRRTAGHFAQVVKAALTLSDSGAERVAVTIHSAPAAPATSPKAGASAASATAAPPAVRQVLLTKTVDFFVAVSTKQ